jgi:hypothetical protein
MRAHLPDLSELISRKLPSRGRRRSSLRLFGVALGLIFAFGAFTLAGAQITTVPGNSRGPQNPQDPRMTMPSPLGPDHPFRERRIRELNVQRQKEMTSDTEKLLKLTADLNAEVAKNHSPTLTPDQLRTLARIEKLAKSVKDKMSNPVQGTIFQDSFPPMAPSVIP